MNKIFKKPLLIILLVIIILIAVSFFAFKKMGDKDISLSSQEVSEKAVEYINENLTSEPVTLISTEEESGLYKIKVDIQGQEYDLYASKDGNLLFLDSISMVPPELKEIAKTETPEVRLFVMSFCPYGNLAEGIMNPVEELLGDEADIKLNYIIYSDYASGYPEYCFDEEDIYCSMHGIEELNQNIRESCVQKYQPEKLWDFVMEVNENADSTNVEEKWEEIAQRTDVDVEKVKECQENETKDILVRELELNKKNYPVQDPSRHEGMEETPISGSPTLVINGTVYDGERSSQGYKEAICSAFLNPPPECDQEIEESESTVEGEC
jgi:hypothetical protein